MNDDGVVIDLGLRIDLDRGEVGGSLTAPIPVRELVRKLGGPGRWALDWVPDVRFDAFAVGGTLDALDLGSKSRAKTGKGGAGRSSSFALTAKGGSVGATGPEASLLVAYVVDRGRSAWMVEIELAVCVDLGSLPVLGSVLSGTSIGPIKVRYCVGVIPAGALPRPAPDDHPRMEPGVSLALLIQSAGTAYPLSYPKVAPQLPPAEPRLPAAEPQQTMAPSGSKDVQEDGESEVLDPEESPFVWFDVDRKFGPLTVGRLGIQSSQRRLGLGFDAALALPVVSVGLTGFQISFEKADFSKFEISLDGLAVAIESKAISVQGGLIRTRGNPNARPPTSDRYDGALMMKIGSYGLAAIGSFTEVGGAPSMLVFALALGSFGGPPVFSVTGIAAGFGYNRDLRLPAVHEVGEFPLVKFASGAGGRDIDVSGALKELNTGGWIPPKRDAYWLALGIQATSFKMVKSFVVVTVQWGSELVIAVLGTSTLTMPAGSDTPFAKATLQLAAVLKPAEGTLKISAELTPDSYVLDPSCRLTGGFAFWTWFGDHEHAGDFVLTLGGYNPHFKRPDWYPVVPRLALDWRMSDAIQITGEVYFALTPSCVMAGGRLSLTYNDADVRASFSAHVDLLLSWNPFYFVAEIGVSISVTYKSWWGELDASLSVNLLLWGPPLRGVARVSWGVFSFTLDINGGGSPGTATAPLASWSQFEGAFLPKAEPAQLAPGSAGDGAAREPAVLTIRPIGGHIGQAAERWLMTADAFAIELQSAIPATRIELLLVGSDRTDGPKQLAESNEAFGAYPLALSPPSSPGAGNGISSIQTVTIASEGPGEAIDTTRWTWSRIDARLPRAIWGPINDGVNRPGADTTGALIGVRGHAHAKDPLGPGEIVIGVREHVFGLPMPTSERATDSPVPCSPAQIVEGLMAAYGAGTLPAEAAVAGPAPPGRLPSSRSSEPPTAYDRRAAPTPVQVPAPAARARASPPKVTPLALFRRLVLPPDPAFPARAARSRLVAYTADRQATFAERAVLDAARRDDGSYELGPGTTMVWRADPALGTPTLRATGRLALRVVAIDLGGNVLHDRSYAGREKAIRLPEGAVTIAASCPLELEATDPGWRIGDELLQIGPFALLGDGCVVGGQAPIRIPGAARRGSRAVGVATGRGLVDGCWVEGASGPERGFLETTLPADTQSLVVSIREEGQAPKGGAPDAQDACLVMSEVRPDEPVGEVFDVLQGEEDVKQVVYEIDAERTAETGTLFRALTSAAGGWAPQAVLGSRTPPADLVLDGEALVEPLALRGTRVVWFS